jgi:hypothetical protein
MPYLTWQGQEDRFHQLGAPLRLQHGEAGARTGEEARPETPGKGFGSESRPPPPPPPVIIRVADDPNELALICVAGICLSFWIRVRMEQHSTLLLDLNFRISEFQFKLEQCISNIFKCVKTVHQ